MLSISPAATPVSFFHLLCPFWELFSASPNNNRPRVKPILGRMRVTMPTENPQPYRRYKGWYRLEEKARQTLSELLAGCKPEFDTLSPEVRAGVMELLRPEAQRVLLKALEGRTSDEEEHFGYDWSDILPCIKPSPQRQAAGRYLQETLPASVLQALNQPEVSRRDQIEWLYDETVGRLRHFTPYLPAEERALAEWRLQCPQAFLRAELAAEKAARIYLERSRKAGAAKPALSEEGQQLAFTAYLIAARKLYQYALKLPEYYERYATVISLKVPPDLQAQYGPWAYVRVGSTNKPASYRVATAEEMNRFQALLDGPMLRNLQEKVCPWTTETATAQKIDANLLARVYYQIVHPLEGQAPGAWRHEATLRHLGQDANYYRLLGFREDIAPDHARLFEAVLDSDRSLREFLDVPSIQEAFRAHRLDLGLVEAALGATVAHELMDVAQTWKPDCVPHQATTAQARQIIPLIIDDLSAYHDALMQSDYLAVRGQSFFKELLLTKHLNCISPAERKRIESYYRPVAVVLAAGNNRSTEPVPDDWTALRSYFDPVTKQEFVDYQVELPLGQAVLCLRQGASPQTALEAARRLLDLDEPPQINDPTARIKGVRLSELNYHELHASCLRPISMARMQFYTSFAPARTLDIMRGKTEEPTTENLIEALRPCFVLHYSDTYCRVKPAEMVRVKYRTPTGEKNNPCWDASQALCGLRSPDRDPEMRERLENPKWGLIVIEGEKKAALLAQMCVELNLPYHVKSVPGVWMGLAQGKLVRELAQFKMRDASSQRRHCYLWFDNDKAFKAGVTHALVETAAAFQREGALVFVPNLPFGRKVKGADDYAQVHCRREGGIDYQPLLEILENAVVVTERPRKVKYPHAEQEREINRKLNQAEQIHELQSALRQKEKPLEAPELRELFLLQAPYLFKNTTERQSAAIWESLNERGRESLLASLLNDNPALKLLRQACGGIPCFDAGPTAKDFLKGEPKLEPTPLIATPELFAPA